MGCLHVGTGRIDDLRLFLKEKKAFKKYVWHNQHFSI